MTEEQLTAIENRNRELHNLKRKSSPVDWIYDSFGFIESYQDIAGPYRKLPVGILVRPITWYRALQERYGTGILDHDYAGSLYRPRSMQCYRDCEYIIRARNGSAEEDIAALVKEVRRLQRLVKQQEGAE
jgi:hypothetical protein